MQMEKQNCNHEWVERNNKNICSKCDKNYLILKDTEHPGLQIGIKDTGENYSVRTGRLRYFFPLEWEEFIFNISDSKKIIFETLLITGARIEEAMMIKKSHIYLDNKYLILYNTKIKSKKKERKQTQREVILPKQFIRQLKNYINTMNDEDFIFLNNDRLVGLDTKQIKIIAGKKALNVYQIFKRAISKTKIEDPWNFSLHNIRKSCGMWLKAMNVKESEICFRLGHDMNTYIKHYGSPDRFGSNDKIKIANKFSGIYGI